MGNANDKVSAASVPVSSGTPIIKPASEAKKCKACCACPETKKIRDECVMQNGEENCAHLIEAHRACMRSLGFNV